MIFSSTLKSNAVKLLFLLIFCACCSNIGITQSSIDTIMPKRLTDPKPAVRIAAVQELSTRWRGDIRAYNLLITALADVDPAVRKYAVMGLRDYRNPRTLPALLTLLNDSNANIRFAVIETLYATADPRAVEPLLTIWQTDKEDRIREQAFFAILINGDMRATDILIPLLNDPAKCKEAIQALGAIGSDRAFEPLLKIAMNDNHPQHNEALAALGSFGDPRLVDYFLLKLAPGNDMMAAILSNTRDPRVVPYLIKDIEASNWRILSSIHLRDERAGDLLMQIASNAEEEQIIRNSAIALLGYMRSRNSIPILVKALKDKTAGNIGIVKEAIDSLGYIGDAQAVPDLLPLLKNDDQAIRSAVVTALRRIQSPLAIDELLSLTKSTNSFIRDEAYYALVAIPNARAVQIVVSYLQTPHENLAGHAYEWNEEDFLTALAANPNMTTDHYLSLLQKNHTPNIFLALANTTIRNRQLLDAMVKWMANYGGYWMLGANIFKALVPYGKDATDSLLARLNEPDTDGDLIITMLGELGDPRAIPPLLSIFENNSSPEVIVALGKLGAKDIIPQLLDIAHSKDQTLMPQQWAAFEALGALKEPQAFELLIAELQKHPDNQSIDARASAARGLGLYGDKRAVTPLISALRDENQFVYTAAAWAILQLPPDTRAIEPLLDILHYSDGFNCQARIYAAEALARFPGEIILFDFCQTLKDRYMTRSDMKLKRTLIRLLGERKDPLAMRAITPFLNGSYDNSDLAIEAARALEQIRDVRAIPALMNQLIDPTPNKRTAVLAALHTLTGEEFGADHARWVEWWIASKAVPAE